MALVQPQMRATDLTLRAPGMLPLHLSLQGVEAPARVRLWDEELQAWDMGALADVANTGHLWRTRHAVGKPLQRVLQPAGW